MKRIIFVVFSLSLILSACSTSYNTVIITPPNYGIVINLNDPSSQATGNDLDGGKLMDVTQQTVTMKKCVATLQSTDRCPDVMVVEVPGAFVTRIYTAESNSGTSNTQQSLCFEASGANGCVDFTVTGKVMKDAAKCYANKVGISPVGTGDEARFHFKALPLDNYIDENGNEQPGSLDNRVVGITSGIFSQAVSTKSPLTMALDKYGIFDELKTLITQTVYEQTCITIDPKNMYISNGIVWSDPAIQDQINQATILANQLELLKQKNSLLKQQTEALLDRAKVVEAEYGLEAAIRFLEIQTEQMKIDKWTGDSWIPFLNQSTPDYVPTPEPIEPSPVP